MVPVAMLMKAVWLVPSPLSSRTQIIFSDVMVVDRMFTFPGAMPRADRANTCRTFSGAAAAIVF
jgi:hypothetical protein